MLVHVVVIIDGGCQSISFLPASLRTTFSLFISQAINSLTDDGLTKFFPFCLFGRRRECGEQLYESISSVGGISV